MSTTALQRLSALMFTGLLALLPFELPIAEAVHGLLFRALGEWHPLLFVGTLLALTSVLSLLTMRLPRELIHAAEVRDYCVMSLMFVAIGLYALIITIFREAWLANSVRQLLLGFVTPSIATLVILLQDQEQQRRSWIAFYAGYTAFFLVSFVFLAISYRAAVSAYPSFFALRTGQRVFMWRFTLGEPWNRYGTYIGNSNKTSNNIIVFLLLSVRLLGRNTIQSSKRVRYLFFAFWTLSTLTLILLFSRAALLVFPLVAWGSGVLQLVRRRAKIAAAAVIVLTVALAFTAYSDAIAYLMTSKSVDDSAMGFLGTYGGRIEDIKMVKDLVFSRVDVLLSGLGTSGFSMLYFGDEIMGTHNTFLDTLVESGIGGLLMLMTMLLFMLSRAVDPIRLRLRNRLGLIGLAVLVMLMTREHSFAYLYATSLGGFCFTALFLVLLDSDRHSARISRPSQGQLATFVAAQQN